MAGLEAGYRAGTPEGARVPASIRDPIVRRRLLPATLGSIAEFDAGHVVFSSDPDGFLSVALPFLGA